MPEINSEMKAAAEYARQLAKEKYGQELDFSDQSIDKLDNLLDQVYDKYSNLLKDGNSSKVILQTANIWGSYLGEFICRKWNGVWILRDTERLVILANNEINPIKLIYHKITDHPEFRVKKYILDLASKQPYFQAIPEITSNNSQKTQQIRYRSQVNQQKRTVRFNKPPFYILPVIGGFLLILIIWLIGFIRFKTTGFSAFDFIGPATMTNTPITIEENLGSATPYPTYTQNPSLTPLPSHTSEPSATSFPTYTPYPTFTQLVSKTATNTLKPVFPTQTQIPLPTSTQIPIEPTNTPKPPTQPPIPTVTKPTPITVDSCEVDPFTVPSGDNVTITYIVHFSSKTPGYGFETIIENPYMGQRGCMGVDSDGDGMAYCDGSSGLLPGEVTVNVTLRTTVGDCVASYRTVRP